MKPTRPLPLFLLSVATGLVVVLGAFGWQHAAREKLLPARPLAPGISISEQLQPQAMDVARRKFTTVIDMRPDGEAGDEPSSEQMGAAARSMNLKFIYVPVPHGDIPESVVTSLSAALAGQHGPVLLYCRSGRRAARSWSLVEASRSAGMSVDAILAAVKASGQDADDLRGNLEKRVQARKPVGGTAT